MKGAQAVILIGAGGHARVLLDALALNQVAVLGLTDADQGKHGLLLEGSKVLGDDSVLERFAPQTTLLVNALGSTHTMHPREQAYERLRARGYRFMTIVHPSAVVAKSAQLGEGVQLMAGAVVQPGVSLGENSIVNTGAQLDHDCVVGRHVHLGPGATLSGAVRVGDATHVGTGAVVLQGITIGARCLIAAGAVVTTDIADACRVAGVPARRIESNE